MGESSSLCGRWEGGTQGGIGHWGVGESSTLCGRCEGGTQGGIGHWGGGGEPSTLCGWYEGGTHSHWCGGWESRLHCVGGVRVVHREVLGTGGGRVVYTVWEV